MPRFDRPSATSIGTAIYHRRRRDWKDDRDLIEEVDKILHENEIDSIVIESTGIGEPIPIAQAFYIHPEILEANPDLPDIQDKVYVDAIITVVDSPQFFEMYERESLIPEDDFGRGYSQLLAEQIEGADILLLNKIAQSKSSLVIGQFLGISLLIFLL